MANSLDGLRDDLKLFKKHCLQSAEVGKRIFENYDSETVRQLLEKPTLFKLLLEKYLEMVESKVVPNLTGPFNTDSAGVASATVKPGVNRIAAALSGGATGGGTASAHKDGIREPKHAGDHREADAESKAPIGPAPETMLPVPPGSRRVIPRYSRRLPLKYSVLGSGTGMLKAFSRDIGAKGLFIQANRPEKTGHQLNIEVVMPEIGLVKIQAVVAWTKWVPQNLRAVDYPGFGVQITNATENWYSYFMNAGSH